MQPNLGLTQWSIPCGTWLDVRVRVSVWYPLILFTLVYWLGWELGLTCLAILFVSTLIHEFFHILAARMTGGEGEDILMWPLGGLAFCDPPRRPWPEFVTVACGPLVNVVLAAASYLILLGLQGAARMPVSLHPFHMWPDLYWAYADTAVVRLLSDLFVVNYALLLFNLLLVFYPFDGGRLVQIALWKWLGYVRSMRIATTIGMVGAAAVAGVGLWNANFMLIVIAVFGFITCMQQRRMLRYAGSAAPEIDPRYAAAYETQAGGRGAWFGGGGGDGGGGTRAESRRAAKIARDAIARRRKAEAETAEIDRILDKVRASGMQSLTRKEQATLRRETDRQRGG